jgi:glycosyltransferase involved in cell wall biosynthesis
VSKIIIPSALFRSRLLLLIFEQVVLPAILIRRSVDVIHSLHYTMPMISASSRIVTIHDMTFILWPHTHTLLRRLFLHFFTKLALRHGEGILYVSESTRQDTVRLLGGTGKYSQVVPLGVEQCFFTSPSAKHTDETICRMAIRQPYFLYLGTIEPRKNLNRLIRAFEVISVKYPEHRLVIAGKLGWGYQSTLDAIRCSPVADRISRIGFVSHEDKLNLISGCHLMVYPSLYEGFGLPVLEAMAMGTPVVTSNTSSLPEVAGTAAVLIDPTSIEQLVDAIDRVLSDEAFRERLIREAKLQAAKYSWTRTADDTYHAYRAVFERHTVVRGATTKAGT